MRVLTPQSTFRQLLPKNIGGANKQEGVRVLPTASASRTASGTEAARRPLHLQVPNPSSCGHFFFLVTLFFTLTIRSSDAFVVLPHAVHHQQNYCLNQRQSFEQQEQRRTIFATTNLKNAPLSAPPPCSQQFSPPFRRLSSNILSLYASTTPNELRGGVDTNTHIPMFTSDFDDFLSYIDDRSPNKRAQEQSQKVSNDNNVSNKSSSQNIAPAQKSFVDAQSQSLLAGTTMLQKTYNQLVSTGGFTHPKTIETLHELIQSIMSIRTTPQNETIIYTTGKNILEHILESKEKQHHIEEAAGTTASTSVEELYKNDFIIFQTLAHLYTKLKMYEQANELYTQVIYAMQCKILGKDNLETIQTLKTIANIYNMQGEYLNAREYYLRCFIACRNTFGLYNEHSISTLHSLSHLYMTKGSEGSNSDSYYYKAFIINQKCYTILVTNGYSKYVPPNLTFHTVHNLALYFHHHHHSKEKQRYERAQSLYEQCFTQIHHFKLQQQRQGQQQRSLTRREEQKEKEIQLDASLLLLLTLHNLSTLYYDQKQYDKAIRTTQQCFIFRKQVLGLYHYDTIVTLCNLGMMYYYQGSRGLDKEEEEEEGWKNERSDDATPFVLLSRGKQILEKCLELQVVVLGEDHEETIMTNDYINEVGRMLSAETKSFDHDSVTIIPGSESKSSVGDVVAGHENMKSETNTIPVDTALTQTTTDVSTTKSNKSGNAVTTAKPMWNNNDAGNQLLQ